MDKLEELLPGIEEFLTNTLATEALSNFAEERRKYFVERLDIVNLPPSVPPREGRVLPLELLKETEQSSGVPADEALPDFAATQREISRSFIEHVADGGVTSAQQTVKDYSDLDHPDRQDIDVARRRSSSENNPRRSVDNGKDNDSDDNENGLYEVPVTKQVSVDETSVSYGAENSSLATTGSAEELALESLDTSPGNPPPLPARRDRSVSDSRSRGSTIDEDDRPPDLPYRPPLPKRTEIYARSEKSDKSETEKSLASDPELSGDGDSTSYESFDEDKDLRDTDVANKYDVKLPKKPKKKTTLRRNAKLRNTKSPLQSEVDVPFKKLDTINISGELLDRGKLKWNRRIVAISNGHMLVYKPDRGARPCLVIPLAGYEATVYEREGRRGCEVRMEHAEGESHTFCLDLKEWAQIWTEHINGHAKGQPPPKYHTHLAGSFSDCGEFYNSSQTYGSKNDLNGSDAYSPAEADQEDGVAGKGKRKKVTRMGSFAYRATQFLENISKKTSGRKKTGQSLTTCRHSSGDTTDASTRPLRLHVPTSRSVGNLTKELMSPTSDSSATSVFGDNSASSPPPTPSDASGSVMNPWETDDNTNDVDIACKGHLSIFSNFNKRCWGKRWCLVRGNNFECYRNEQSSQCELSFPLKPCQLRRAVSETNSQNGLMLVEADKEKITVEPLSKYEMGQWVRVLLRETSTEGVPEGLEEFLQEENTQEPPVSAETARAFFSHEYEDPEETLAAVAQLKAQSRTQQGTPVPAKADQNANIVMGPDHSRKQVPDSKMLTSKYNQITDSGFYSVKENNSDSDSSCGSSSVHEKLEGGYSTVVSPKYHRSSSSHRRSLESSKTTAQESSLSRVPVDNSHTHAISSSYGLSASQASSRSSTPSVSKAHSNTSSIISHQQSHHITTSGDADFNIADSERYLKLTEHSKQNSARSGSPRRSSQTVVSPSGEEYSIILKRSDRRSTSQSSSAECEHSAPTSDVNSKTSDKYDTGKCIDNDDISKVKHSLDATKLSITDKSIKSLHFDPVISKRTMKTTVAVGSTRTHDSGGQKPNISKFHQTYASSSDQPPPVPTSPIPSLHRDGRTFSVSIPMTQLTTERPRSSSCVVDSSQKQTIVNSRSSKEEEDSIANVQESWTHLISKPNATVEELQTAIDSFKNKQVEIKRKRMAVHDKRQRVLSDEERLACEKEFAALEKLGECTDHTIRTLQNHLEHLQGHTLGAVNTAASRHSSK